jgi:hypothetical protein
MVAQGIGAQRFDFGLRPGSAELVHVNEARVLADVDVVRPEHLDLGTALPVLQRPSAADDLRLPPIPIKARTAADLKAGVRGVRGKAEQPIAADPRRAERIFRLAAFLSAYEEIQADIDARRQSLD